jgi:RimJ/RimL family protein N-acetyltransferase
MSMSITQIAKQIVRLVVHDYRLNWVYASTGSQPVLPLPARLDFAPLDGAGLLHIRAANDLQFRKALGYDRLGADGYVLAQDGIPCCVAHFVDLARYENATIWPLRSDEVALLNIVTDEPAQGRGYAAVLISNATPAMLSTHFTRAIAFIWWNHRASLHAFERAGWQRVGFSVELIGRHGTACHLHLPIPNFWSRNRSGPGTTARSRMPHALRH